MRRINVWDHPSAVPLLRKLWSEGVPCTPLAKQMSAALRQTITRNSVIGKVHRLGLQKEFPRETGFESRNEGCRVIERIKARNRPRPAAQRPSVNGRPLGVDYTHNDGSAGRREIARKFGADMVAHVESGAGVESLNARPFATFTGCKWPLAGGRVCCNPIAFKGYCEGHASVAYINVAAMNCERAAAMLTRFDGVIDLSLTPPAGADTEWDGGRLAA